MSLSAALQAGRLDPEVVTLVERTARAVVRTGHFTTPNGARQWSAHDVDDLVQDFFASPARIFDLAATAVTSADADDHLRALIQVAVKRVLIDRLRRGPMGVLLKRIKRRLLKRDDVVAVAPTHWALVQWRHDTHWGGDDARLVAAANAVEIAPPPPWPEEGTRQGPVTTSASLDATCTAVLGAARSPVPRQTVHRVVAERVIPFDTGRVSVADDLWDQPTPADPDLVDDLAASEAADVFWEGLSDGDRRLLPKVRVPARQLEADGFLNLRKSAISSRQARLEQLLVAFVGATPNADLAFGHLMSVRETWLAGQDQGGEP